MNIPGLNSGLVGLLSSLGFDVILPGVLQAFAAKLRNKDANNTGVDDASANAIDAIAPLAPAIVHGSVKTQRQVVDTAISALQNYKAALDSTQPLTAQK